jgi:hypothetical protein
MGAFQTSLNVLADRAVFRLRCLQSRKKLDQSSQNLAFFRTRSFLSLTREAQNRFLALDDGGIMIDYSSSTISLIAWSVTLSMPSTRSAKNQSFANPPVRVSTSSSVCTVEPADKVGSPPVPERRLSIRVA